MRYLSNFYFYVLFYTQVHLCMAFKLKTKCRAQEAEGLYFTSKHLYQINPESTESFFCYWLFFQGGGDHQVHELKANHGEKNKNEKQTNTLIDHNFAFFKFNNKRNCDINSAR